MFANVTLLLEERPNVLSMPASALVRTAEETLCYVVDGGKVKRTPVKIGMRSGDEVEIVSGVTEQQLVVTVRPEQLTAGQQVEVTMAKK